MVETVTISKKDYENLLKSNQKTIDELQEKINSLAQENQNMKEENQFHQLHQIELVNLIII